MPGDDALRLVLASARNQDNPRWILHGKQEGEPEGDPEAGYDDLDDSEMPKPSKIVEESHGLDPQEWFSARRKEFSEDFGEDWNESEILGEWPSSSPGKAGFSLHTDILSQKTLASALVAQHDLQHSWELPATSHFGGWNECPDPEVHCAIWRYWQEKYDAHIVGMSSDVLEAVVLKPPSDKESCLELAWEQYIYCCDIVDQGVQTVANLASLLLGSESWYFWWD